MVDKQELDLAQSIGEFIEYWGFKKIHGKVWTLIFLAEESVDAQYLMNHLGVSKALMSMTLKELLHFNVIKMDGKKSGKTCYTFNPDIAGVIVDVLMNREAKMLKEIKSNCELLKIKKDQEGQIEKSNNVLLLKEMIESAEGLMQSLLLLKNVELGKLKDSLTLGGSQ